MDLKLRCIDLPELITKPGDNYPFFIYDRDFDQQKRMSYGSLKQYFLKTDEPSTLSEELKILSSVFPTENSKLTIGSAGEFSLYTDGNTLIFKANQTNKSISLSLENKEIFKIGPENNIIDLATGSTQSNPTLINMGTSQLTYDGTPNQGLSFTQNFIKIDRELDINENIRLNNSYISRDGDNQGIYIEDIGVFVNEKLHANGLPISLQVSGTSTFIGNIYAQGFINKTGNVTRGLKFDNSDNMELTTEGKFKDKITVDGTSKFIGDSDFGDLIADGAEIDILDINTALYVKNKVGLTTAVTVDGKTLYFDLGVLYNVT